jgi:hypothetical protein
MAKKCLNFWAANLQGDRPFQVKVCADSGFYRSISGHPQNGANLIAVNNGVETIVNGAGFIYWAEPYATRGIEQVAIAECPGCIGDDPEPAYDIINGSCIQAKIYQTPGKYSSLNACTADLTSSNCQYPKICVPPDYCPPGMVCLPSSEFSQISGLASSLEKENCS